MLGEDSDAARIITAQEMLMETALSVTEGNSRSDFDNYDEKSALKNTSRRSTHSITIADSSDKANSFIYLLKLYLPLVHKIAFANKFQLYHNIKYNIIYYISLHIKHPQSISPIFLILFLNSNNESLDFTTAGRLFHMKEPGK